MKLILSLIALMLLLSGCVSTRTSVSYAEPVPTPSVSTDADGNKPEETPSAVSIDPAPYLDTIKAAWQAFSDTHHAVFASDASKIITIEDNWYIPMDHLATSIDEVKEIMRTVVSEEYFDTEIDHLIDHLFIEKDGILYKAMADYIYIWNFDYDSLTLTTATDDCLHYTVPRNEEWDNLIFEIEFVKEDGVWKLNQLDQHESKRDP